MTSGTLSYGKVLKQNHQVIHENTVTPIGGSTEAGKETTTLGEPRGNAPLFLRRNLKLMRKHRNMAEMREQGLVSRSTGLVHCIMPRIGVINYEIGGEDAYTVKRRSPIDADDRKKQDVRKMCEAAVVRERSMQQAEKRFGSAAARTNNEVKRRRK